MMHGTLFIGLDVGTTTSKAVVFTENAEPVASGRANTPWTITTSGAELDAAALLAAAKSAVAEALSECPPGPIGGLGVASLAESGVLLNRRGTRRLAQRRERV
jgi:sugar (pentulose or hexulose) kinase